MTDVPYPYTTTFELTAGIRVEIEAPVYMTERPLINDVHIVRPHDQMTVDADIPDGVQCELLVEMDSGTYRIEVQDGVNEYAITDGEVQEE